MIADLGAGVLAGLGVALPLGAIGALLVGLPATAGPRAAVAAALGVATTDGLYAAVAVLGGTRVADAVHPVAGPLRILAALVLAGLAVLTLARARRTTEGRERRLRPVHAYIGFVALTALNPATLAYFLALVLGARVGGAWFVVGVFVASAAWQLVLVGGGTALTHRLATPRGRAVLAGASAVVMLLAAARALAGAVG